MSRLLPFTVLLLATVYCISRVEGCTPAGHRCGAGSAACCEGNRCASPGDTSDNPVVQSQKYCISTSDAVQTVNGCIPAGVRCNAGSAPNCCAGFQCRVAGGASSNPVGFCTK